MGFSPVDSVLMFPGRSPPSRAPQRPALLSAVLAWLELLGAAARREKGLTHYTHRARLSNPPLIRGNAGSVWG